MKKCFKCGLEKEWVDFYKHTKTASGYMNKCKVCTKKDQKANYSKRKSNPDFVNKERQRCRDKYYRLGNGNADTKLRKKISERFFERFPEKLIAKKESRWVKAPLGLEKHHWSYNPEHTKDVIFLSKKDHNTAHRFIVYDQERMMYRTHDTGVLLDTKDAHENYIRKFLTVHI